MLVDLTDISAMTNNQRREDPFLLDLKAILLDENSLRIVENVKDMTHLGERIFAPFKEEVFVDLRAWHPLLPHGYCP